MTTLYELTNEYLEAVNKIEELDLEPEAIKDTLDSLQFPIEHKAENIIKHMKNLEADEKALKEESARLKEKADYVKKKREQLKNYLDYNLQAAGIRELKAGLFEVRYRKGSEIIEINEEELPKDYWVPQDPKPLSKTELKKLIKSGNEIEGVRLVRNPDSLIIK